MMVSILLPLYIYPAATSWQPLLSAAHTYPNIDFNVIVNPNNGPGVASLPDSNYISALNSLYAFPNINLLGYVRCRYGDRGVEFIEQDIATYANWEQESTVDISLDGIFLDEVPSEIESLQWMADIASYVRETWEAGPKREGVVVYNPGVIVDESFYDHADAVVAFEDAEEYWSDFVDHGLTQLTAENRAKTAVIVHTCDGTAGQLGDLVSEASKSGVASIYATNQAGGLYNEWPGWWESLAQLVAISNETGPGGLKRSNRKARRLAGPTEFPL